MADLRFSAAAALLVALGCVPDLPTHADPQPFRDDWQLEHEGPFEALDEDGVALIASLRIGSMLGNANNFINRGDVIVRFDGAPDTIRVELRRFATTNTESEAEDAFDHLSLWAYSSTAPKRPAEMTEDARCGGITEAGDALPWQDDCAILVYYEGIDQTASAGADVRVTLPPDYRESLSIETADSVDEDSYPNRGNVCVEGLPGSLHVEMQSGVAMISIAARRVDGEPNPFPTCPDAIVRDCLAFDDPSTPGPDPWHKDCGCVQNHERAAIAVTAVAPAAADVTVDMPVDFPALFHGDNAGNNMILGKHCTAVIDGFTNVVDEGAIDPGRPWSRTALVNGIEAAKFASASIDVLSSGCEHVDAVESPDAWADGPATTLRGNLELCAGCLTPTPCEALLPGG